MGFVKETAPSNAKWRVLRRADDRFEVRTPDNELHTVCPTLSHAADIAGHRNKELAAAARRVVRPCLCCQRPFESEGIHNRLCDGCRRMGEGPMPCGVATASRGGRKPAR